jgi:hypothetical protein
MTCPHCRLATHGGYHSPLWCFDYTGPARPAAVRLVKPQPVRGQWAVCALPGCANPSGPGFLRCPGHCRAIGLPTRLPTWTSKPWRPRPRPAAVEPVEPGPVTASAGEITRTGVDTTVTACPGCPRLCGTRPCYPGCGQTKGEPTRIPSHNR